MHRLLILLLLLPSVARAQTDIPPTAVFDTAWRYVRLNFYDRDLSGVDWKAARDRHRPAAEAATTQAELSAAINALLAELKTSHTAHFTPEDVEYYHLLDVMSKGDHLQPLIERRFDRGIRYEGLHAWLKREGDSLFITGVWPGGNAQEAGLRLGDEILAIHGQPPAPVASFRGKAGELAEITIRREKDGPELSTQLRIEWIRPGEAMLDAMRSSVRLIEKDGKRIGYIQILSYAGRQYHDLLLEELFEGTLANADALLIDIRGGWGGASPEYLDVFLPGPTITMQGRIGPEIVMPRRWKKPVGMLIDEGSRSGKEVLAYGFRQYDLGPLIGERTAGAVVGGTLMVLPDDSILYLAVSDVLVDGKVRLEGVGVEPTIEVPFDPRYADGNDPQLDRALQEMSQRAAQAR
jgi:carboxyl-terminal processing protease